MYSRLTDLNESSSVFNNLEQKNNHTVTDLDHSVTIVWCYLIVSEPQMIVDKTEMKHMIHKRFALWLVARGTKRVTEV